MAFDAVFAADGIRILTSQPAAPRANAIQERLTDDRLRAIRAHLHERAGKTTEAAELFTRGCARRAEHRRT